MRTIPLIPLVCLLFFFAVVAAAENEPPCKNSAQYRVLDFWMGDWDVYWQNQKVGTNRIESMLNGCAVMEHWKDLHGREGKSFFYVDLITNQWKQVWVTDQGSMKEKVLLQVSDHGSVRFQGEVLTPGGKRVWDRTTLAPASGGGVRQVIEQSTDAGKTWVVQFDAIYKKAKRSSRGS